MTGSTVIVNWLNTVLTGSVHVVVIDVGVRDDTKRFSGGSGPVL